MTRLILAAFVLMAAVVCFYGGIGLGNYLTAPSIHTAFTNMNLITITPTLDHCPSAR
jgi:hypothetical protein